MPSSTARSKEQATAKRGERHGCAASMNGRDRVREINEIRRLIGCTESKYVQGVLQAAEKVLRDELRLDVEELSRLQGLTTFEEVASLLKREVACLEPFLQPCEAPGYEADVEEPSELLSSKRAKPKPLDTQPREKAAASELFDPLQWAEANCDALPAECWRPLSRLLQVPRWPHDSPQARRLLSEGKPVILTGSSLVAPAVGKWDLDFLVTNMAELQCTVFKSKDQLFRYWDPSKLAPGEEASLHTERVVMSAAEFAACVRGGGEGHFYLQTPLVQGVSEQMLSDFKSFEWLRLNELARRLEWGPLTSNLLLVGQRGNTTPAHYDEQQNIFAQLRGVKRVVLFSPADVRALYPFPVAHANDRQSQVDMYSPDISAFPRFAEAQPFHAVLQPGELLYIPQYWWHHVENLEDECVSLNFWFKDQGGTQKVSLPLSPAQHLAMRRNIEKLITDALGAHEARALMASGLIHTDELPADALPVLKQVRELLAHVMAQEQITPWLRELVEGRFR